MPNLIASLSSRELAILCWIVIFVTWMMLKSSIRRSLSGVIKSLFAIKLVSYFAAIAIYTFLMAWWLQRFGLWNSDQLKNTLIWYFTIGAVSLRDIVDPYKNNHLRNAIKDVLGLTAILQFVIEAFTFSFWIEMFLVPVLILGGALMAFARHDKDERVIKFMSNLFAFAGLAYLTYIISQFAIHPLTFLNKQTLIDFGVPSLFSFLYLPFLYLLSIIVMYNDNFLYLKQKALNGKVFQYARWQALLHFQGNKTDFVRWKHIILLYDELTKENVDESIRLLKISKKAESNPPSVSFVNGWSPYEAKDFLCETGINTQYYKPVYEKDWMACSTYIKLQTKALLPDTIAFYVEGIQTTATKLTLSLHVNDKNRAGFSISKFIEAATLLYTKAMGHPPSPRMNKIIIAGKHARITEGNRSIEIIKDEWKGKINSGFNLSICIKVKG